MAAALAWSSEPKKSQFFRLCGAPHSRKNYLFAGADAGADRIATACTILGSAHLNDIDPLAYVTDVITKLQAGWPMARIDELLPDVWAKTVAPS